MPLPNLNTLCSTSTRRSLDNLSKELLCSLTNDAKEEYSQVERRQPFRIEIPPPPQDWWNWPIVSPSPSPSGSDGGHSSKDSSEPLIVSPEPALRKRRRGRPPGSKNKKTILRERIIGELNSHV